MTTPNPKNNLLSLIQALQSNVFRKARQQSNLIVPMGMGISGNMEILDLSKASPLLIAGSVTSGKREFVNGIIASLAIRNRYDEVQLLLDDVTRVELVSYNHLPHLLRPVNIDLDETADLLHWLDNEINARYQKLVRANVSNIESYNRHLREKGRMAYLVVVIYELSDLMYSRRDVAEPLICKLAKSGPSTGVHLVIVTQRPQTEVFTNSLKSVFRTRICFNVVSDLDSKVVLDMSGAEKLSESADMLLLAAGTTIPQHLMGFHISDAEIDNIQASGLL
jgi:DNA segregation ATPase FtsK/SpoIIIE, S-DNA-T family